MKTTIRARFHAIVGHIRLRIDAKRNRFPIWIKGKYIYGCYCWMGLPAFERWRDHLRGMGLKDSDFAPLRGNGDLIATYRLMRSYRDGRSSGSDYAFGDSGKVGDFKLVRIDRVPNATLSGNEKLKGDQ